MTWVPFFAFMVGCAVFSVCAIFGVQGWGLKCLFGVIAALSTLYAREIWRNR